jgi:hypothetical protein
LSSPGQLGQFAEGPSGGVFLGDEGEQFSPLPGSRLDHVRAHELRQDVMDFPAWVDQGTSHWLGLTKSGIAVYRWPTMLPTAWTHFQIRR